MSETDWTEGKGLKDGFHDMDWNGKSTLGVTRIQRKEYDDESDKYIKRVLFQVKIQWGSLWGTMVFGTDEDFKTAFNEAIEKAINDGCPAHWLPEVLA